jgi:uncharacterized protein
MSGETNLDQLIRTMRPELQPGEFVFATSPSLHPDVLGQAAMTFREAEGVTAIVPETVAKKHGLTYTYRCQCITLNVHSSLEAVGFLAVITTALAKAGIGVNPVSAYFHDHLFIAEHHVKEAMQVLEGLLGEGF